MNKYQAKWGNPPRYISINPIEKRFLNSVRWDAIPLDSNGLYDVEWMQWLGIPIASSKVITERQVSIEGKNIPYTVKYRVDTFVEGTNQFSPRICLFYRETRGCAGYLIFREAA